MLISESYKKKLQSLSGIGDTPLLNESSRVDFIKNDFVERIGRKWDKFFASYGKANDIAMSMVSADEKDKFINLPEHYRTFQKSNRITPKEKVIKHYLGKFSKLEQADPTQNKQYLTWLVNIYLAGNLLEEDFHKIPETLDLFYKHGSKLPLDKRNINTFKSLSSLYNEIHQFAKEEEMSDTQKQKLIKLEGAEQVYDDPNWKIIIPITREAACLYGSSTQWCTASKDNNYFDRYNKQGPLYIIINKSIKNDRDKMKKLQFHFETNQYMDTTDAQINITQFFNASPELKAFFKKEGKINTSFEIEHMLCTKEEGLVLLKPNKEKIILIAKKGYDFFENFYKGIGAEKEYFETILNNNEFIHLIFNSGKFDELITSYIKNNLQKEGVNVISKSIWLNEWILAPKTTPDNIQHFIISLCKLGKEGKAFASKSLEKNGIVWNALIVSGKKSPSTYFNTISHGEVFGKAGRELVIKMLNDKNTIKELKQNGVSDMILSFISKFYSKDTLKEGKLYLKNILSVN